MFQVRPVSKKQLQMVNVNSFWPCKECELNKRRRFRRLLWYGECPMNSSTRLRVRTQAESVDASSGLPAGPAERWGRFPNTLPVLVGPIYFERSRHFNLFHFQICFKLPWLRKRSYVFINTISKTIFHSSILVVWNIPSPHHHSTPEIRLLTITLKQTLTEYGRRMWTVAYQSGSGQDFLSTVWTFEFHKVG